MCATCGCSDDATVRPATHDHNHARDHRHEHEPAAAPVADVQDKGHTITLEQRVLAKNDRLADRTRTWLTGRRILAVNLMSSPGAGKTTLLERTITGLPAEMSVSVVEGDQETLLDADRINATGCRVVQINTGSGCHLDAAMVDRGLRTLDPPTGSVVFIENVGNLVCPALFDLGESAKIVITSTTEGEDKPLKYPQMFACADLVLLNKIDLLPYLEFDVPRCLAAIHRVNPRATVFRLSATTGAGMSDWYGWLRGQLPHPAVAPTAGTGAVVHGDRQELGTDGDAEPCRSRAHARKSGPGPIL